MKVKTFAVFPNEKFFIIVNGDCDEEDIKNLEIYKEKKLTTFEAVITNEKYLTTLTRDSITIPEIVILKNMAMKTQDIYAMSSFKIVSKNEAWIEIIKQNFDMREYMRHVVHHEPLWLMNTISKIYFPGSEIFINAFIKYLLEHDFDRARSCFERIRFELNFNQIISLYLKNFMKDAKIKIFINILKAEQQKIYYVFEFNPKVKFLKQISAGEFIKYGVYCFIVSKELYSNSLFKSELEQKFFKTLIAEQINNVWEFVEPLCKIKAWGEILRTCFPGILELYSQNFIFSAKCYNVIKFTKEEYIKAEKVFELLAEIYYPSEFFLIYENLLLNGYNKPTKNTNWGGYYFKSLIKKNFEK